MHAIREAQSCVLPSMQDSVRWCESTSLLHTLRTCGNTPRTHTPPSTLPSGSSHAELLAVPAGTNPTTMFFQQATAAERAALSLSCCSVYMTGCTSSRYLSSRGEHGGQSGLAQNRGWRSAKGFKTSLGKSHHANSSMCYSTLHPLFDGKKQRCKCFYLETLLSTPWVRRLLASCCHALNASSCTWRCWWGTSAPRIACIPCAQARQDMRSG